jgi:hypothetical protein
MLNVIRRQEMQKTAIKVNTIDTLSWPERCPNCGQDLKEGDVMRFELKIKKGLKAFVAAGFGSKNLPVKICGPCAKKVSNFRTIEGIGGIVMFVAIIGPVIFKKIQSMDYIYVIGSAFWLGVILMSIAEVGMKKAIGMECRLLSMNKWSLKFRDDLFCNEFLSLNARHVERM